MTIDRFSKIQFEEALPVHKESGKTLWVCKGLVGGEYEYFIPVRLGVGITIRSSIREDFHAAATGADSIRIWASTEDGKPHGSKLSTYVTRVPGWDKRMVKQLRIMWKRISSTSICVFCGKPKAIYKSKKKDSLFQACPEHFGKMIEGWEEK